jgi:aspartate racemase
MKTIGLIGGMTWLSTADYYRWINAGVQERLGGSHSAECILYSVDFDLFERLQEQGDWDALSQHMIAPARRVERAGRPMPHAFLCSRCKWDHCPTAL